MKHLLMLLVLLTLIGCYQEEKLESTGYYSVTSDSDVEIYYTDGTGNTQVSQSDGSEWVMTIYLKEGESPDPFYYDVVVVSLTGVQHIKIVSEFEGQVYLPQVKEDTAEQVEHHSAFCPEWTTKCAKVKINF